MKKILVIGSTGQIGSELTMKLRSEYQPENVVAGYIPGAEPKGELAESGPKEVVDITNAQQIADVVRRYDIDAIYNLAALLSAVAERKPLLAWHIGIDGLINVLEVARENECSVFTPSSIGSFGPNAPKDGTPQDTIQQPRTIYGVTKVTGELLSNYYFMYLQGDGSWTKPTDTTYSKLSAANNVTTNGYLASARTNCCSSWHDSTSRTSWCAISTSRLPMPPDSIT